MIIRIFFLGIIPSVLWAETRLISYYPELTTMRPISSAEAFRNRPQDHSRIDKALSVFLKDQHVTIKTVIYYESVGLVYAGVMAPTVRDVYFFVDSEGNVIQAMKSLDLSTAKHYKQLKERYIELRLWPEIISPPVHKTLKNGEQQFIFKQLLLNECRTCEQVGIATVIYTFNSKGLFKSAVVTELTPSINDSSIRV